MPLPLPPLDANPTPPPAYVYGPSSIYPEAGHEKELCDKASSPDWLYLGTLLALDVGAVWAHTEWKYADSLPGRMVGPGLIGLTWGATIGGGYLALPKCDKNWVGFSPREGKVREDWPLAVSLALLGGATAPVITAIVNGPAVPQEWSTEERTTRVLVSGGMAFVGALVPYLLPPKTWRAAKELEHIRAEVAPKGAFIGYSVAF